MTGEQATAAVIDAIDTLGIPYMIVGSFSSNHYGIPRSTGDANFVLELGSFSISQLARQLGPEFKLDPQMSFETVTGTLRYEAELTENPFKIEFFLLSRDPHDQERFQRRVQASILGKSVWFPSVEDVIITKLRWALIGNRSKDRDDVRDVIAVQSVEGRIDWDYVHAWCDRHGTRALLDEVRRSIPSI
jgi:hypothetical protein